MSPLFAPTTALSHSVVEIADILLAKLVAAEEDLGLATDSIYYGDQVKIPRSPAVCVEPDLSTRVVKGVPRRTEMVLRIYLLIYHSEVRDPQSNRRDADALSEAVSDLLHEDQNLGGKVIHCFVSEAQSGYADKQTLMRCTRLTFEATTHHYLPVMQ